MRSSKFFNAVTAVVAFAIGMVIAVLLYGCATLPTVPIEQKVPVYVVNDSGEPAYAQLKRGDEIVFADYIYPGVPKKVELAAGDYIFQTIGLLSGNVIYEEVTYTLEYLLEGLDEGYVNTITILPRHATDNQA